MEMKDTNCGCASVIDRKSSVRACSACSLRVMITRPRILQLKYGKHFIFAWSVAYSVRRTLIESIVSSFSSLSSKSTYDFTSVIVHSGDGRSTKTKKILDLRFLQQRLVDNIAIGIGYIIMNVVFAKALAIIVMRNPMTFRCLAVAPFVIEVCFQYPQNHPHLAHQLLRVFQTPW